MKVRTIVGVNEAGDEVKFPSLSAGRRAGFSNIKRSMDEGKPVKGYMFSFEDSEDNARTVEDSLNEESTGAGDTLAKVLNSAALGPITNAFKKLIWGDKDDCGCAERMKQLNEILPYGTPKARNFFTESMYEQYRVIAEGNPRSLTGSQAMLVAKIHAHVYSHKFYKPCASCGGGRRKFAQWTKELTELWRGVTNG